MHKKSKSGLSAGKLAGSDTKEVFQHCFERFSEENPFERLVVPAFKKSENKSIIMDFCGLKFCKYNRFPCYVQTTKLD